MKKNVLIIFIFTSIALLLMIIYIFTKQVSYTPSKDIPIPTRFPTAIPETIRKFDPAKLTISPDESVLLKTGQKQTFTLTFPSSTNVSDINVQLTTSIVPDTTPHVIAITTNPDISSHTILVTMGNEVQPDSVYHLTVSNTKTNDVIYQARFAVENANAQP